MTQATRIEQSWERALLICSCKSSWPYLQSCGLSATHLGIVGREAKASVEILLAQSDRGIDYDSQKSILAIRSFQLAIRSHVPVFEVEDIERWFVSRWVDLAGWSDFRWKVRIAHSRRPDAFGSTLSKPLVDAVSLHFARDARFLAGSRTPIDDEGEIRVALGEWEAKIAKWMYWTPEEMTWWIQTNLCQILDVQEFFDWWRCTEITYERDVIDSYVREILAVT